MCDHLCVGLCLGCALGKGRRQRIVCRRRKCSGDPLLRLGTSPPRARSSPWRAPLPLVCADWLLEPRGEQETPLPALFLHKPFKCEMFHELLPQMSMHLKILIPSEHLPSLPRLYLVTIRVLPNPVTCSSVPDPSPGGGPSLPLDIP